VRILWVEPCSSTPHHLCIDVQVANPNFGNDSTVAINLIEDEHEIPTLSELTQQCG
jgi:hypothetical protein